jgi:ribokinase
MGRIVVAGSINRDLVAYVDTLPRPGETVLGGRFRQFPGGKGANQAVAASRLGGRVRLMGNVGDDAFGDAMRAFLAEEAIELSEVAVLPGIPTGIALITVDAKSENSIVVIPGANLCWNGRKVEREEFDSHDVVVCQFEIPVDIVERVFARAKENAATTILNPAPIREVPSTLLSLVDHIVLNEVELGAIVSCPIDANDGQSVIFAATKLRERSPANVIATLGARGAILVDANGSRVVPSHRVQAVDTTGAGDCFIGAFAAALANGTPLREAIAFATKAAAISVTRDGAASSMPTLDEVSKVDLP